MRPELRKIIRRYGDDKESIDIEEIFKSFIYKRKIALIIFAISISSINIFSFLNNKANPSYQGSFQILIKDPIATNTNIGRFAENIPVKAVGALDSSSNTPTLITYLKSELILSKLAKEFNYDPKELSSKIEIKQGGENGDAFGVLNIYLNIGDAKKGEKILKKLSQLYIDSSLAYRRRKLENGIKFINNEKPDFERKIKSANAKLNKYKEKYEIIPMTQGGQIRISNLIKKDDLIKQKIKNLLLENQNLKKSDSERINKNNIQISEFKNILDEIENEFKIPSQLIRNIEELQKQIMNYDSALGRLISLSESYRLEITQNSIPWTIISKPDMSYTPKSRSFSATLIYSGSISIFISCLSVFLALKFSNQFRDEREIQKYFNLKSLGVIPKDDNKLKFQNSIEDLCFTLKAIRKQNNLQSFYIASSIANEGKSKINIALAKAFSTMGEKILLIDTNTNNPQVHEDFKLNCSPGILDILSNKEMEFEKLIKKSNYNKNLDVITAGFSEKNEKIILDSTKIKNFINQMKKKYSFIIFDGESINNSSRSLMHCEIADYILILISCSYVKKNNVDQCLEKLLNVDSNLEGILINNLI